MGKIQEGAPIVYQKGKQLKAKWQISKNMLSFEVENYNPNYELIIDPITRVWGTYYGGSAEDRGKYCTSDKFGYVYLAGDVASSSGTIIATSGSHQSNFGGYLDAFLVKFDANGTRLWGTYYGGGSAENGISCAIDGSGNVYFGGTTASNTTTLIASPGSHQPIFGGGTRDAFLVKFDASGVRQWGTYYGGNNDEQSQSCAVDASGDVYLTGYSNSTVNIAINGAHQTLPGNAGDAFLVKFNGNGVRQWGTYYGGAGTDIGSSCQTDINGNVYLAGTAGATSSTGIASIGSHQSSQGGGKDAFLVKFDANGTRQWGTYYGGTGPEDGLGCTIDPSGNIYMSGLTNSNNGTFIATVGSHQATNGGGTYDAYLVKFDVNGIRQWGTYYGGAGEEWGRSCSIDSGGNVILAGHTDSNAGAVIATASSYQSSYGGGTYDAFLVKFNGSGVRQWGSYYGGSGEEQGYSCAIDINGSLYLAGHTDSNTGNAIASSGSHQAAYGGGTFDAFLAKFDVCEVAPVQPSSIAGNTIMCGGSAANIYSVAVVTGATSYTWSLPSGWSGASNSNIISTAPGSSGIFTIVAGNACGVSPQQTLNVTVNPLPVITVSTSSALLCVGETATLTASGGTVYNFNPGGPGAQITISPTSNTTYTVAGIAANSCSNIAVFTQSVDACAGITKVAEVLEATLKIYPNPTNGILNIELDSENDIVILNSLGQIVYTGRLGVGINQLEVKDLAKGVYVVKVASKSSAKFIME